MLQRNAAILAAGLTAFSLIALGGAVATGPGALGAVAQSAAPAADPDPVLADPASPAALSPGRGGAVAAPAGERGLGRRGGDGYGPDRADDPDRWGWDDDAE